MKKIISLTALFCMAMSVNVQNANAQIISGKITNEQQEPVDYATVVLQTPDSVYVQSTYTDSLGVFRLESELTEFRLIIEHLLYEPFEESYFHPETGSITLNTKENVLNEVVIKGERPLVAVVDGKLTYDIPRLIENKIVNNAYESLLQLPGVREQEDNLILAGANSLTVILNGKPTGMSTEQLMQLLKNIPAALLEKAEVMYSAPPQYHVRGAAINLVLQNRSSENSRLLGQINSAYTQKYYANYSAGSSLFYSDSKFSADFLYSFDQSKGKTGDDIFSHHLFENTIYDIEQANRGNREKTTHNIRLDADYKWNENNKTSLAYTAQISPFIRNKEESDGTYSHSVNNKTETSPVEMHNISLNYTSGFGLDAAVDYTYYKNHSLQNFQEKKPGKENTFFSHSNQDIDRLKAYIDQTHQLKNNWTWQYGAEFSYALERSLQSYHSPGGQDLSASNTDNELREYSYGLYTNFQKSFTEKFSLMASFTGEYYRFEDFSEWTLFPSFQATYLFSPAHILQGGFSSDKTYPAYWEMNGAIGYLNGYTEIHGNPLLKPYKEYSSQLSYIFKGKYILTVYGSYMDDYFVQLPYQATDRLALIFQATNFDYKQTAGLNLILPVKAGQILDTRLTLNGFYSKVKNSHFHDLSFEKDQWTFYSRLDNTILISSQPDIRMELAAAYLSKSLQGPIDLSEIWDVDAGIRWRFADKKAELNLKGTDLFNSWAPDFNIRQSNQRMEFHNIPDTRSISLSFTYKFGGEREKKERKEVDTSRFGK